MTTIFKSLKVALVVTAIAVTAQAASTMPNVGFKGGFSVNSYRQLGSVSATRWQLGAFVDYGFAPFVNGQVELNYLKFGDGISYLTVPVLYKAKFNTGTGFLPYLQVGPEMYFKLQDDTSTLKSVAFGAQAGAGAEYWFTPNIAGLLELRYTLGLSEVFQNPTAGVSTKTGAFQVLAGMSFAL